MSDPIVVTQTSNEDPSAAPEFSISLWDSDEGDDFDVVVHIKTDLSDERPASPALLTGLAIMIAEQQGTLNKIIETVFPIDHPTEKQVEAYLGMLIQGDDSVVQ
jgi:hypothetical protein